MKKDVVVSIRGLQIDELNSEDAVEIVTKGQYSKRKNKAFLRFEEVSEDRGITKNVLAFDEKSMELTRRGGMQLHMSFLEQKKTMTNYDTPFGDIVVGIDTRRIEFREEEEEIQVCVDYALELNFEYVADCQLTVQITPGGAPMAME